VGAVVVAQRGGDAGIVSERDIVAAIAAGAALDQLSAGDVATRDLISADPGDRIIDVAQRLIDEGVRHVALVDRDEVVGVLSIRDLFGVLVDELRDDPAR
jgi:CBS domain-containing protein